MARTRPAIPTIRRTRLVDDVADALRDLIARGELAPGSRLVQDQLASELGVSRTPLREAIQRLQHEGLLTLSSGRGVEVRRMEPGALLQLFDVREVIDGLAARLAAERATPDHLRQLRRAQDDMERALTRWNPRHWLLANLAFHERVIAAAQNPIVEQVVSLIQQSERTFYPRVLLHQERAAMGLRDHQEILAAISSHDGAAAEAAARAHIRSARAFVAATASTAENGAAEAILVGKAGGRARGVR